MTYYYESKPRAKVYVPFDPKYSPLEKLVAASDDDDFLGQKAASISYRIKQLYNQIYKRKEISRNIIEDAENELVEAGSKIYMYRYAFFFDSRKKMSLERRIDLLEKTKRSELVDYWRDMFKINMYIIQAGEEYKNLMNKRKLLQ